MLRSDYQDQNCSVARALEAVGERWTLLIVRELLVRPMRFSELERRMPIAKNTLSARLEKLVQLGVAERTGEAERGSYRLTRKGLDLFPVLDALMAWGDTHASPEGAPVIVRHSCGGPAGHRWVCETCGHDVDHEDVTFVAGPGWRA